MVNDTQVSAIRNAVTDVMEEIAPYRYIFARNTDSLETLTTVFYGEDEDEDGAEDEDERLVQAARNFLSDMHYWEGHTAQLDDALDLLRAALGEE